MHATHNLFVQAVFDRATVNNATTPWIIGEFGFGLVITVTIAAALLLHYRRRSEDRGRNDHDPNRCRPVRTASSPALRSAETFAIQAGRVIVDAAKPALGPSTVIVENGRIKCESRAARSRRPALPWSICAMLRFCRA